MLKLHPARRERGKRVRQTHARSSGYAIARLTSTFAQSSLYIFGICTLAIIIITALQVLIAIAHS